MCVVRVYESRPWSKSAATVESMTETLKCYIIHCISSIIIVLLLLFFFFLFSSLLLLNNTNKLIIILSLGQLWKVQSNSQWCAVNYYFLAFWWSWFVDRHLEDYSHLQ